MDADSDGFITLIAKSLGAGEASIRLLVSLFAGNQIVFFVAFLVSVKGVIFSNVTLPKTQVQYTVKFPLYGGTSKFRGNPNFDATFSSRGFSLCVEILNIIFKTVNCHLIVHEHVRYESPCRARNLILYFSLNSDT